jgi:hypothetical protein
MQKAERQIAEKRKKLLHASEIRIARIAGKSSTGNREGPTLAAGRLALLELQMGMAC